MKMHEKTTDPSPRAASATPAPHSAALPALVPGSMLAGTGAPRSPANPGANHDSFVPDATTLLRAVARHRFLIVVLGTVVGAATASAVWFTVSSKYIASATLRVRTIPPHVLSPAPGTSANASLDRYLKTQGELMRMPSVLAHALNGPENPDGSGPFRPRRTLEVVNQQLEPELWLRRQIRIQAPRGSEFVNVVMAHEDSQVAADLVNAVVYAYFDRVLNEEDQELLDRKARLEELRRDRQESLEVSLQSLEKLAQALGGTDRQGVTAQQLLLVDEVGVLRKELMAVEMRLLRTQVDLRMAEELQRLSQQVLLDNTSTAPVSDLPAAGAAPADEPPDGAVGAAPTAMLGTEAQAAQGASTEAPQRARSSHAPPSQGLVGTNDPAASPDARQQTGLPATEPELIQRMIQGDSLISMYRAQVHRLEQDIRSAGLSSRQRDEPRLVRLRHKLDVARASMAEREAELEPKVRAWIQQTTEAKRAFDLARQAKLQDIRVQQLRQQMKQSELQRDELDRRYKDKYQPQKEAVGKQSYDLEVLRKKIASDEALLNRVDNVLQTIEIEAKAPERIELIESAKPPSRPDNARRTKLTLYGGLGGFGAVAFLIGFMEVRRQRIMAPEDVSNRVGVAVVGTVPQLPFHARRVRSNSLGAASRSGWHRVFQESVDALRAQLMFSNPDRPLRTVMVTSAVAGEGKTVLATHLAVSLARAGQRTLLIDADLRRPSLHELFDVDVSPGLVDLLKNQRTIDEVIVQSPFVGLDLLMAGSKIADPPKLLSDPQLSGAIERLSREYSFVVLDLPPVLPFSDALLVGQHVDGALFSVLRDVSQTHHVRSASERLRGVGVDIIGAVLGGVVYDNYMYQHYQTSDDELGTHGQV